MRHYTQHFSFLESLWRTLPVIAKSIGKNPFKRSLEGFIEPLHYSLRCENVACSAAAAECVQELSRLIGPNIFNGRVEQCNPDFMDTFLDALQHGHRTAHAGMPPARGAGAAPGLRRPFP